MNQHDRRYQEALEHCHDVAREEYDVAKGALGLAQAQLGTLVAEARQIHDGIDAKGGAVGDAKGRLKDIASTLEGQLSNSLEEVDRALLRKRDRLDKFTVTLFGRTMAGKSTIREALTGGDGTTIGKGAQRTTRDIREYEWGHLCIIDTPGIGAYQGDADRELALSVIDRSDVVLFLVSSDGIQETAFRGMKALRQQNKPIIFLLNVKKDLTKPVYLRQLLRDPSRLLGLDAVQGHIQRIRYLAEIELQMRQVRVIPIHAQAAFLASRPENGALREELRRASQMDRVLETLRLEVCERGPVRRVQTILDGTTSTLVELQGEYRQLGQTIRGEATYLKQKFSELDDWLNVYIPSTNQRFEREAQKQLAPLRKKISSFVDDHIESKKFGEKWQKRVKALELEDWMGHQQKQVHSEIVARLQEFQDEVQVESTLLGELESEVPSSCDPWDGERTMRWISAEAGVVASIAALAGLFGATNFWNPVGWVAGGVAVITLGLSFLFGNREKKLQKEKKKASKKLRKQVEWMERKLAGILKNWFYEEITRKLVRGIRRDTRALYGGMYGLACQLNAASKGCDEIVGQQNIRFVGRVSSLRGIEIEPGAIARVVRDPGVCTKLQWAHGGGPGIAPVVGRAIGEGVSEVRPGPDERMVVEALTPARVEVDHVHLGRDGVMVRVNGREMGRAIGRRGANIKLAQRLLQRRIQLKEKD